MFPLSDAVWKSWDVYLVMAAIPLLFLWSERSRWIAAFPLLGFAVFVAFYFPWSFSTESHA